MTKIGKKTATFDCMIDCVFLNSLIIALNHS